MVRLGCRRLRTGERLPKRPFRCHPRGIMWAPRSEVLDGSPGCWWPMRQLTRRMRSAGQYRSRACPPFLDDQHSAGLIVRRTSPTILYFPDRAQAQEVRGDLGWVSAMSGLVGRPSYLRRRELGRPSFSAACLSQIEPWEPVALIVAGLCHEAAGAYRSRGDCRLSQITFH